jgi:hypothetical protein
MVVVCCGGTPATNVHPNTYPCAVLSCCTHIGRTWCSFLVNRNTNPWLLSCSLVIMHKVTLDLLI